MMLGWRRVLACVVGLALQGAAGRLQAQERLADPQFHVDSDHDGMSDGLEQRLLVQFAPLFMVGANDCSVRPAEFRPGVKTPEVVADNGTIYGQVFPAKNSSDQAEMAELHFYHLWRRDCGGHGHPLDTEHVAVLVRASDTHLASATWTAVYWYAAAHENTVCDVSQIARAATLRAEHQGATVWISPGKHASYLDARLCQRGCGADHCEAMVPLKTTAVINLGEPGWPMNGSRFIASSQWPLLAKMSATNFPAEPLARLNALPLTDIAWYHAGRHPAQGIIARSSHTEEALARSGQDTSSAISVAEDSTGASLSGASDATASALASTEDSAGNALAKSYRHTRGALGTSARHVGEALHLRKRKGEPAAAPQ